MESMSSLTMLGVSLRLSSTDDVTTKERSGSPPHPEVWAVFWSRQSPISSVPVASR
ncbi:hypothetical protein LEMLEM_LOCUS16325 [Lemmus lemmus]